MHATHPNPPVGPLALALAFGVVLPVGCLAFDPIVFRASDGFAGPFGGAVLGAYKVAGYTATRRVANGVSGIRFPTGTVMIV